MLLELVDGGLAVTDGTDPIALALEVRGDGLANGLLVLDQQNLLSVRSHDGLPISYRPSAGARHSYSPVYPNGPFS